MSDTPIDTLIIDIEAKASNADDAIDKFAKAIGNLASSLASVDTGKLNSVGNSIQRLSNSLQTMKSIDTRSINSVVSKINSLSAINTSQFATVSANLNQMANGIQSLGTVSANVASVGELAKNISKLGNKSVQTAVTNIPLLATALNGLMNTLSKAPRVSQNVLDMVNALANLSAQGSKVGSASNSIVKGLNKASTSATKANKSFKGLASTFGKFYANCFLAIRGIKSLWNSIEGTADYLEAFNYFEVALNKVGGDWASDWEKYSEKLGVTSAEEYANSFKTRLNESLSGLSGIQISVDTNGETGLLTDTGMKNLGLNIQEVTQYASQLASVTNSVGQTGEATLATASAFTKLGADMSSLFNVDYSSVMDNLQSGLIGQSRALYKYGIDITNATLQTYAYELGVEKAVSEMTQAEKMQLRMIAILDQSRVSWGDQANTINSLSNSIRQFKNNISEAGQILGQLFVPILSKVMPIVNGLTIAIKRLMVSVANIFGIKLDLSEFGQGTSGLEDDIDGITDAYEDATAAAKKFSTTTLGIDELNINSPQTDTSSGTTGSVGGGLDLTDEILKATSEYEKAWQETYDRMENMALGFANRIEKALEPIKKIFEDIKIGDWFAVGQDTSGLISDVFIFISDAIAGVDWEEIGENIGTFLRGIKWLEVMESLKAVIWEAVKGAIKVWFGMFKESPFETSLITAMATWKFTKVGSTISSKIASALKAKGVSVSGLTLKLGAIAFAWEVGFEFGKELGKFLFPEDAAYYDDFKWFGEGGFFKEFFNFDNLTTALRDLKNAILSLFGLVSDIPDFNKAMEDISLGALYTDKQLLEIQTTYSLTTEQMEQLRQAMLDANPELKKLSENYEALGGASAESLQQIREGLGYISSGVIESGEAYDFLADHYTGMTSAALSFFENVQNGNIDATEALGVMKKSTGELGEKIKKTIVTVEGDITDFFNNSSIYKAKGIEMGTSIGNGIAQGIENLTATIAGKVNSIVSAVQNSINGTFGFGVELATIPQYKTGGFPEDGLFWANRNELVGTFSNGKTAVANNEDIQGGIKQGVKEGVTEILAPYLAEIAQNTREAADKDFSVAIGDREIYKANLRGAKATGRLLIT